MINRINEYLANNKNIDAEGRQLLISSAELISLLESWLSYEQDVHLKAVHLNNALMKRLCGVE